MSENNQSANPAQDPANSASAATATPPVQDPAAAPPDATLGYKDTDNQSAAGYKEHADPADKPSEFKFNKEGHDEKSIKLIETYAKAHDLNEKQVEGFANFIKGLKDSAESQKSKSAEEAKREQHLQMQKDFKMLKEHPEFGKELEKSFMEANKVLDLMPDFKKQLTASGKHVDPVLMLGLKGLYSKLYGQDGTIVQGGKPDADDGLPIWDKIYGVKK